jgi:glycosyltransferase involved in cell wall biosynthesis
MRIAYIAPYQGPTLLDRRPIVRNRSMSNRIKIELIAALLRANSHEVEVLSQGEVVDNEWRFYSAFSEPEPFHPEIPVYYASALPIRRVNGLWTDQRTLQLFRARHRVSPFDLVIVFNLKTPQLACANYAIRHLGLPVILEYEDDRFVNVVGEKMNGFATWRQRRSCARLFGAVSGCIAVSPHLLAQLPTRVPKMLLRGVVGEDIVQASKPPRTPKRNWVFFSGTHIESNGIPQLIQAWPAVGIPGWELHITGYGHLTDSLRAMAASVPGVTFHGLVSRPELVELMSSAKICVNPHALSQTPGNVFAFKIIEYLAAGAHVVTTPMGILEQEVERGITYMADNFPKTIAAAVKRAIETRAWERDARQFVIETYGEAATARSLEALLSQVVPSKVETEPVLAQVR